MRSVTAGFTACSQSDIQRIVTYAEISWDGLGAVTDARGAAHWTNETAYLLSHTGDLKINPPGDELVPSGEVGTVSVVLDNKTQRFAWRDPASPLAAYINTATGLAGKPIRLYQGYPIAGVDHLLCIFTGVIASWKGSAQSGEMILDCRDWGYRFVQNKLSSAVAVDQLPNAWTATLAASAGITQLSQDVGLFPIPYCWLDDESVVDEIWQTWAADGGLAYFNQIGTLLGANALNWIGKASVWTFDEGDYVIADEDTDVDQVATKVTVEWAGRTSGSETVLYTLDRYKTIMPGQTESWTARYQNAASSVITPSVTLPSKDYAAQSVGGVDMTSLLTITLSNTYAQQCTVAVKNNSTVYVARLTFFQLRGYPLIGGPTEQIEAAVAPAPFSYERVRQVRGNPYLQTQVQGQALANLLAVRAQRVRSTWRLREVLGIPQLELGDRVTFTDNRALGSGNTVTGIVIGIHWVSSATDGFVQELRIMDDTYLAAYDDYFVIGTDMLGDYKRAYY